MSLLKPHPMENKLEKTKVGLLRRGWKVCGEPATFDTSAGAGRSATDVRDAMYFLSSVRPINVTKDWLDAAQLMPAHLRWPAAACISQTVSSEAKWSLRKHRFVIAPILALADHSSTSSLGPENIFQASQSPCCSNSRWHGSARKVLRGNSFSYFTNVAWLPPR